MPREPASPDVRLTPSPQPSPTAVAALPIVNLATEPLAGEEVFKDEAEVVGAGWLRSSVRKEADTYTWYMRSTSTFECTVSVGITVENMIVEPFAPVQVVPAQSTVRLIRYSWDDHAKAYTNHISYHFEPGDFRASPAPYVYALPWTKPDAFTIDQGWHGKLSHTGEGEYAVDIGMPEGTEVRAAREGTVVVTHATATTSGMTEEFQDLHLANFIYIRHPDATYAKYWHLAPGGVLVHAGQQVARGELIGHSGNTGHSTGPHLHFELGAPVDGTRAQSFPFRWLTEPQASKGLEPAEGSTYSAFEFPK